MILPFHSLQTEFSTSTSSKMTGLCCIVLLICAVSFKVGNTDPFSSIGESKVIEETDVVKNKLYGEEDTYVTVLVFEGAQFRSAIDSQEKLWDDGIVPFEISDDYRNEREKFILDAMEEFNNKTCIRFTPKKDEKSYIMIKPGDKCQSAVGRSPNVTTVTMGEACFTKGIVIHELMHALGFIHEQNRPDRDEFVRIDFENVIEEAKNNFDKFPEDEVQTFNQTYDYGSIMHYGAFDFAKNRNKPTIIPLKDGVEIGQREGFSEKDLIKINLLYNCNKTRDEMDLPTTTSLGDEMDLPTTTSQGDEMDLPTTTSQDTEPREDNTEDDKAKTQNYQWFYKWPIYK